MPYHVEWCRLTPAAAEVDFARLIAECRARVDAIRALPPSDLSFGRVFAALDECEQDLARAWRTMQQLGETCDSGTLRGAIERIQGDVVLFLASVRQDAALWSAVRAAQEAAAGAPLGAAERRLVDETVRDFVDAGAALDARGQERIREIERELVALTTRYAQNCLDSQNAWELFVSDARDLAGVPASAVEYAASSAASRGRAGEYRFTLQSFSVRALLQHCSCERVRRLAWEGRCSVGSAAPWDNGPIVARILALRQEKAALLGFQNIADMLGARRMVGGGAHAQEFIAGIRDRVKAQYDKEMEAVRCFQENETGESVQKLKPWNVMYYAEKMRQRELDFDDELMKPYFALENVLKGLFEIFRRLYGVEITERKTYFRESESVPKRDDAVEVWHPECRFFEIRDGKTGTLMASVYCDFFPRETKSEGAWHEQLIVGCPHLGRPHLGVVCTNLTKPVEGKPALLTHDDVETIFHEFGHMVHQSFSEVPYASIGGTNVAFDFGEVPSHFNENFTWEKECLDLFAFHFETGEKLPEKYLQNIIRARNFNVAIGIMKQLRYSMLDLEMHMSFVNSGFDNIDEFDRKVVKGYGYEFEEEEPSMARDFLHLFSDPVGYAAGYYSYKYSEVLESDIFSRFKKEGVLNHSLGMEFREKILSKGNSKPASEIFNDFMGREPTLDAYLRRSGIKENE